MSDPEKYKRLGSRQRSNWPQVAGKLNLATDWLSMNSYYSEHTARYLGVTVGDNTLPGVRLESYGDTLASVKPTQSTSGEMW